MFSIAEIALMNFSFLESGLQGGRNSNLVTKTTFFDVESNGGYIKAETFKSLMTQLKETAPNLWNQYKNFFDCVKEGFLIRNTLSKKKHLVNLSEYYYIVFTKGRIRVETTIYEVEELGKFIKDYADGLISTNFTLDDLIGEANK